MPRKKSQARKRTTKTRKTPSSTRQKFPLKYFLVGLAAFALAGIGFYSYSQYRESGIEQEGLIVCGRDGSCKKALHIHSALVVSICGEFRDLAKDTGELADIHTHKQSNVLHFHERLEVTPEGEVLDWSPLKLSNAVKQVTGLELTNECIGEFCNGSTCPNGKRGRLSLTVVPGFCSGDSCPGLEAARKAISERGEIQEEIADYVWKDGDLLELRFE